MSGLLDGMAKAHSQRMAAHTAMLAHLGIDPGAEDAPRLHAQLRGTLLSCARCRCPVACSAWIGYGQPGTPPWCGAGPAFDALALARAQLARCRAA